MAKSFCHITQEIFLHNNWHMLCDKNYLVQAWSHPTAMPILINEG